MDPPTHYRFDYNELFSPDRTACPRTNINGPKVFENGEMTMFLPKHHLSQEDLINQCDDLRMKYKNIVSRLPKKMRKKCKSKVNMTYVMFKYEISIMSFG